MEINMNMKIDMDCDKDINKDIVFLTFQIWRSKFDVR